MTAQPLATILLSAILAACDVGTNVDPPDGPTDKKPPPDVQEDQHFCCEKLGGDGKSGEGCITIDITHAGSCDKVLYCGGSYENDGGKVTCA